MQSENRHRLYRRAKQNLLAALLSLNLVKFAPPGEPFTLTSGRKSDYYIDCRPLVMSGLTIGDVCRCFSYQLYEEYDGTRFLQGTATGVGGRAILGAMLLHSSLEGVRVGSGFVIREGERTHGTKSAYEGWKPDPKANEVVMFDDVLTSGKTALELADRVEELFPGCRPTKLIVIFDRCEGGRESLLEKGIVVSSVLGPKDLEAARAERERNAGEPEPRLAGVEHND